MKETQTHSGGRPRSRGAEQGYRLARVHGPGGRGRMGRVWLPGVPPPPWSREGLS